MNVRSAPLVTVAMLLAAAAALEAPGLAQMTPPLPGAAKAAQLALNTASEAELSVLPGIGEAEAKKIIAGRPHSRKDELVQRKILARTTYEPIKYHLTVAQK